MHGLGNDFVILDGRSDGLVLTPEKAAVIADRRRGVGCDQIVILEPSETEDCGVRFYNADGSESDACGNASRCVADILMAETGQDRAFIRAGGRVLDCARAGHGLVTVDMGAPSDVQDLDLKGEGVSYPVSVDMGNPHCVFFVDDVEGIPVEKLGPVFENNPLFPHRTNVEFVQVAGENTLRQRTWERGAGLTQACGSGACAVAVAAVRRGLVKGRKVDIDLDGGRLILEWRETDDHVLMTGPVTYVFDGVLKGL